MLFFITARRRTRPRAVKRSIRYSPLDGSGTVTADTFQSWVVGLYCPTPETPSSWFVPPAWPPLTTKLTMPVRAVGTGRVQA